MGIPAVQVCALTLVAESMGPHRLVPGVSVLHPVGNPAVDLEAERTLRRTLVERALELLGQRLS